MDKTNGSRTHNHHTCTYTLPVILEPHMLQTQKLLQAQHYTFSCLTSSNLVLWGCMGPSLSAAQGTVCAKYLELKDLPLPGWVRLSLVARALEHGTAGMSKTLEFTQGEPWLWATEFENVHETWRFAEPRLTIDGVEYEDSEAYYQEHNPAAGDWSETANEQRVEVMCTALDAKFAASGEARALLVASHPHRLLSIKRDRFWGFDEELGGKNMLGELLTQLRKGYVSEYASEVKQISQVNVVGKRRRGEGGGGGAADPQDAARPFNPPESREVVLQKRRNEKLVFDCFFQNCGVRLGLRFAEITDGNCMLLCLVQQILVLQMRLSNIFFPITQSERKEKAMNLRKRALQYMRSHCEQFEVCLCEGEDLVQYCDRMAKEDEQGDDLLLSAVSQELQVNIQVFEFHTITNSIIMYKFFGDPSQSSASPICSEANFEILQLTRTLNVAHYVNQFHGTSHYNSIEGEVQYLRHQIDETRL